MKTQTELEQDSAGANEFEGLAGNPQFDNVRDTYGSNDVEAPPLLLEDDARIKKFTGPLLLGPFIPAILAVLNITYGQILVVSWTGTCGYALDFFVMLTIVESYIFLFVYFWIFLGKDLYLTLPLTGPIKVLSPFTSLAVLGGFYLGILLLGFVINIYGTYLLDVSALDCEKNAPDLYRYVQYLVYIYWIIFSTICIFLFNLVFGSTLEKVVREKTREPTIADAADNIFKSKYKKYDPGFKERQIERKYVKNLLKDLGVFIPPEEVEGLLETWDPEETGHVSFDQMNDWFREMNEEIDDSDLDSDDSNLAEDKEVAAIEKQKKAERAKAKMEKSQAGLGKEKTK